MHLNCCESNIFRTWKQKSIFVLSLIFRISRTTRLLKIINIVIRVTIILLTDNLILISIAFTVLQTILLLVSCKKFTFQTIISEYCFSTGILCGFISCLDFLVSILLNLTYCFIGEGLFMILLFFSLF